MRAILVDVFTNGRLVTLWVRAGEKNVFLKDFITPSFFVSGTMAQLFEAKELVEKIFSVKECFCVLVSRKEFYSNSLQDFLEIVLLDTKKRFDIKQAIERRFGYGLNFFNSDLELDRLYLFEKNVKPLQEIEFFEDNGWAKNVHPIGFENFVEKFPEFKTVELEVNPSCEKGILLDTVSSIRLNDKFFFGEEQQILVEFKKKFEEIDADIVLTMQGNKFEIDLLKKRFEFFGIGFDLGRFPDKFVQKTGKSYFSYGRVIRHEPARYLRGRLHIQINDFHYNECGLEGIFEIAHCTVIPIQKAARLGSGNCISNLQFYVAFRKGFLVPEKKFQVEKFNSGWHLFEADKGGLVYEPITGLHENVVEIDFSSLYPSIMVNHNISAETILCNCCDNKDVPELGYNLCHKRRGLIPEVLEPLLQRRLYYKKMKSLCAPKELESYKAKSNALKWLLVVSFGYTGFKNARFGRIEAHQSICAFAREKFLQAAEICEEQGFEIVHGIVDALYIKKQNHSPQEIEELIEEIRRETGVEIVVEGVFKWIVFTPRINNSRIATPTKFFGLYNNGEFKVRGLFLRKHDTPPAVVRMQSEQLQVLSGASNRKEFFEKISLVLSKLREWVAKLENGLISDEDLAVSLSVSKKAEDYKSNIVQKSALLQLQKIGAVVNEGETIKFVYSNFAAKDFLKKVTPFPLKAKRIDVGKYSELFVKGTLELLNFLHVKKEDLFLVAASFKQTTLKDFEKEIIKIKSVEIAG